MDGSELRVGPELDAAVARACGFRFVQNGGPCQAVLSGDQDDQAWVEFCPSTDLNAAFDAAEKAGVFPGFVLFETPRAIIFGEDLDGRWYVSKTEFLEDAIASGNTPAEAICRAILKVKGTP